jgi:hypothetical protein
MNSFAVVRGDDMSKVRTTLCDLIRYAHLSFEGNARRLEPAFADNILIHVMKIPLRMYCEAASIVPLNEDASVAIGRLRKIHPPGHVIIVSPRHEIYHELVNFVDILPEIELDMEWGINLVKQAGADLVKRASIELVEQASAELVEQ